MTQRFLLLFHPRSGSNLIATTLAAHPSIVMYGELFNHLEAARRDVRQIGGPVGPSAQTDYLRDGGDPVAFLQQQLFQRSFPPEKTAVGFKLSHHHLRQADTVELCRLIGGNAGTGLLATPAEEVRFWNWLGADREIRIISLYRQRLLETMVSLLIAVKTQQWLLPVGGRRDESGPKQVHIPVEDFRQFIDFMTASQERACALLADHPLLTLEYQVDVVDRFEETMKRIEAFLGVGSLPLPPRLQKQSRVPVSEAITNFAELQKAVAGTKYEAYL
jgi:hypothetical protein